MSSDGDALVLTGEPGVGKSALLWSAGRQASGSGALVLRGVGVEFEATLEFAALHQLLLPLLGALTALSRPHREALTVALGLGTGAPPPPLLVSAGCLALLRQAARERP